MAARALPSRPYHVLSVVGTRPEAIKMAPIVRALASIPSIEQHILLTGQHRGLADAFDCIDPSSIHQLHLDVRERSVPALQTSIRRQIAAISPSPRPNW